MSRMKLFGTALSESTSRMDFDLALESAENAMNEFAELAKQNEQMVIVNIEDESILEAQEDKALDGIEEGLSVTRVGLNAVNALNDTRLLIAPQIIESTRQDIQLVRQVATTAAAGMGIDPADLLPENMDNTVGQQMSLNMEGFKSTAAAAIAAIWRFIRNVLDYAFSILKSNFNILKVRTAQFIRIADHIRISNKKNAGGPLSVQKNWISLTSDGSLPETAEDVSSMIANLVFNQRVFTSVAGTKPIIFRLNKISLADVPEAHAATKSELTSVVNLVSKEITAADERGDLVSENSVAGSRIRIVGGADVIKAPDRICKRFVELQWVNSPADVKGNAVPCLTPVELRQITTMFLKVLSANLNPTLATTIANTCRIQVRETEAEADAFTALLTQTEDDSVAEMITDIARMRRGLVTFRWSAYAQYMRTVADVIDGMTSYVKANYEAQT